MKTLWMVKHKASGAFETKPKATAKVAWEEFWYNMERCNVHKKIVDEDFICVEVTISETGSTCTNLEW